MLHKPQTLLQLAAYPQTVIAIAALVAILPMLVRGPSCGHDFDFHLLSWLEAAQQFPQGTFPHWAYTPAFNAGEPRFIFYPPLSWSLGAVLGLILPWTLVPAAFTWIALTLSGFTFYALASRCTSSSAATLGAVLYLANPYMLFTAYERSAFAELLAAAWLPLLMAAALDHPGCPRFRAASPLDPGVASFPPAGNLRIHILPIAVPIALLWLTNAPAAVMATYALAFLTLVRLVLPRAAASSETYAPSLPGSEPECAPSIEPYPMGGNVESQSRFHLALITSAATTLGLALAAFYILPAAYERRFVQIQMAVTEGMRVSDHFLFHHMPGPTPDDRFHDAVVRTASLTALTLLASIAAALLALTRKPKSTAPTPEATPSLDVAPPIKPKSFRTERGTVSSFLAPWRNPRISLSSATQAILPLALLTLLIAFLLTPISLPVWTHVPDLAFLQFPWRLTALLGLIFAFFATLALPSKLPSLPSSLFPLPCLAVAALLIAPAWHLFHQPCDPEDSVPARVALFHSDLGTDPTDEYTPIDADPDALHPHDPPYWLIPATPANDSAVNAPPPATATPGPAPHHLTLTLPTPEYLVLNVRDYPAWRIALNHTLLPPTASERRSARNDGLIALLLPPGTDTIELTLIRTPDETIGFAISALALVIVLYLYVKRPGTAPTP